MASIGVIGAGAWGTALAIAAARHDLAVTLWAREPELVAAVNERHVNELFLPNVALPKNIVATDDLAQAAAHDFVLFVPPTQHLRDVFTAALPHLPPDATIITASKGIEIDSLLLPSQIINEVAPAIAPERIVVLTGPSFAQEVARGLPVDLVAAGVDVKRAERVQQLLHAPVFRVYTSTDAIGAQVCGALKNVIAIACGGSDGMRAGLNARAALITRSLAEMTRTGVALGADPLTFLGLAGVGDLVLTCTGELSRNRTFGLQLAEGKTPDELCAERRCVVEGFYTVKAAVALADRESIDMPIARAVYAVCYEGRPVLEIAKRLLERAKKSELTGIVR